MADIHEYSMNGDWTLEVLEIIIIIQLLLKLPNLGI